MPDQNNNEKTYINNNYIANHIPGISLIEDIDKEYAYKALPKQEIYTLYSLHFEGDVSISKSLNAFDKVVMDCVYTMQKNGVHTFTANMIARAMDSHGRGLIASIELSLEKLQHTFINIKAEKEMKTRKKDTFIFNGYLFPVVDVEKIEANGRRVKAYEMLSLSPLYEYAESTNQIISVPAELLQIEDNLKNKDDTIILRRYVIQRIEQMKNKKNSVNSTFIGYYSEHEKGFCGIYELLDISEDSFKSDSSLSNKKAKVHKSVCSILDALVDEAYISSYDIVKNKSKYIIGVDIRI